MFEWVVFWNSFKLFQRSKDCSRLGQVYSPLNPAWYTVWGVPLVDLPDGPWLNLIFEERMILKLMKLGSRLAIGWHHFWPFVSQILIQPMSGFFCQYFRLYFRSLRHGTSDQWDLDLMCRLYGFHDEVVHMLDRLWSNFLTRFAKYRGYHINQDISLKGFHLRWLNIKGIDAFVILTLFCNHLK